MTEASVLRQRAARRAAADRRRRSDRRYGRVMGRFVAAGLLQVNHEVPEHQRAISVADVLWVGKVEPRVLELLPAALLKLPGLFEDVAAVPADLAAVLAELKRAQVPSGFRGVPGPKLLYWVPRLGRRDKLPSRLKSFRFQWLDQVLLERLRERLQVSETEVLRRALAQLDATLDASEASSPKGAQVEGSPRGKLAKRKR